MQEIYASETLRAVLNRGTTGAARPAAMVTFEGRAVEYRKQVGGMFAQPLADRMGIDIVHVIPRRADWYHYPDMDDCLAAVRPFLDSATLAYGSSMGGYAVARFADRLGVARGLCLSPQYSIQKRIVPFESRWQEFAQRIAFLHDDAIAPRRAQLWLFADLCFDAEERHVRLIAESGPTQIVSVPYGGHPVGRPLVEVKVLQPILQAFLDGTEDRAGFERMIAGAMERSPTALLRRLGLARGVARNALLEQIIALEPENPTVRFRLGLVLLRAGRISEAEAQLAPVLRAAPRPQLAARYRRTCETLGVAPRLLE
jgi:hypothetical protein